MIVAKISTIMLLCIGVPMGVLSLIMHNFNLEFYFYKTLPTEEQVCNSMKGITLS